MGAHMNIMEEVNGIPEVVIQMSAIFLCLDEKRIVRKCGWMKRKHVLRNDWEHHWFELEENGTISCYTSLEAKAMARINYHMVSKAASLDETRRHCGLIIHGAMRNWSCVCQSKEERDSWIELMQFVLIDKQMKTRASGLS